MTFFVVSDIHSYFYPFKEALDKAGFDPNNKDHWLVSCGDAFDRGPDSEELLYYLMSLERKILIKGNHDSLLEQCCIREFPLGHDFHNGTKKTIDDIGGAAEGRSFDECCVHTLNKTAAYRDLLVNYLETENYIFVHSFIPLNVFYDERASKPWHKVGKLYSYRDDWRNVTAKSIWEEAMWGNPFELAEQGLNKTGKIIVFGHWHCSAGWSKKESISEFGDEAKFDIYFDEVNKVIGIDRCTAHTGEVNILVIEDNFIS